MLQGGEITNLFAAAHHGYLAGKASAKLFGASHRGTWHLTATSGAVAATAALARFRKLDSAKEVIALKMVITNLSGSPQAGFERKGATQLNRAFAANQAITAVNAAEFNAPYIDEIWDSNRGVVALYNLDPKTLQLADDLEIEKILLDATSSLHLRVYFATGFASSAIAATLELLQEVGTPDKVEVELSKSLTGLLDGTRGGIWWNPRLIIQSLMKTHDPFNISENSLWNGEVALIFGEIPVGGAKVSFKKGNEIINKSIDTAPFNIKNLTPEELKMTYTKWENISGRKDLETMPIKECLALIKELFS